MEDFQLEPDERIIKVARKHFFVFFLSLLPLALLAWLPTVVPDFLRAVGQDAPALDHLLTILDPERNPLVPLFLGLWWLVLWIGTFNQFTQFYLNHWVITNVRIVRIRQYGFFDREVSNFLLARVQDVSTSVDGIFSDLIGYGTVQVETAGIESGHFIMDGIANPEAMRDLIMREISDLNQRRGLTGV